MEWQNNRKVERENIGDWDYPTEDCGEIKAVLEISIISLEWVFPRAR